MRPDLAQAPLAERIDHLYSVISSQPFLDLEGLGNEVPFFICPFDPAEAFEFEKQIDNLCNRLAKHVPAVRVLNINLYDLSVEIMRSRNIWERTLQAEPSISKNELKELLQNVLDAERHFIPAIDQKMREQPFDVLFLTGVGAVYPFIRSHTVLNNLQRVAKDKPTVMFFPGEYQQSDETGAMLVLFGRLKGDKYYRAFNIYHVDR